ncbi:hypothetical protein SO802_026366 [Lithocarpus litseifolius]|uniref:Uncharacterized protein n=1 Tax=Lithocarpus litseifolius TaxID=425828 RepID=A0AAW2BZF1_9ROSI
MSRSSEVTSESSVSAHMESGNEESHSSRCEYTSDKPSGSEQKLSTYSPLEEEKVVETLLDENMEVGYSDHRRPLYLAASINQIPIKRALVDIGTSVNLIPLSTLQAAGMLEGKIRGCPMEVMGFGRGGEYIMGHIQLWLKDGPIAFLARFHVVKIEVSYHILLGRPWLHKHQLVPSTYHQCMKGSLNGRIIRIAANLPPFEPAKAHLVETMFYDEWAPSSESLVSKPQGTFVPRWEDIQDDLELDLRELLKWRKKRKEARPFLSQVICHVASRFEHLTIG